MTAEPKEAVPPAPGDGPENPATVSQRTTDFSANPTAGPLAEPPPGDTPVLPQAFGRYQVRRVLGTGGFGAVYLCHDTQLDRPVAVKVLHAGPNTPHAEVEGCLQEARRLAQLRHPGVVTVHDVGVDEGRVYVVSDYLDGPHLGQWLKDNRPAWPEAARIAAAVADALAHAHSRLIVHRDVKPGNIILTADRSPVLVDFGLALDDAGAGGREKGAISGTPSYMSPEQVAGTAHRIDGRTDIYSLGAVLYEMLTGRVPFRSNDLLELWRQVSDDEPQPPRQLAGDIPPELEKACLKALAKKQQNRYTTAADFAEDLRRVQQTTAAMPASTQPSLVSPSSSPWPSAAPAGEPFPATLDPRRPDPLTPTSSRRRAREAERRQMTVLVCGCDLFESEAYLEGLQAEEQAKVLQDFEQACAQAIRRFDGTILQCNEQGLLVCFGYPVAFEDGPRRAAWTGLGILADMKALGERLRRDCKVELIPWVGLHTGLAVVEAKEDTVSLVGEARNVAVRLADVAAPGQILCSAATYRLIQGQFRCISLGARKIKGLAEPVDLYEIQGVGEARSAIEAEGPAGLTPLTGRDHEVNLLKDRWEQAEEGMGQVVLLSGEPGMGKLRLVHTLKEHVLGLMVEEEQDAPVIEWRCAPHFQNTGLYPAIDFFERDLAFDRQEPAQARFDRLVRRLEQYNLARPEVVALWASLLSLPIPVGFPVLSLSPVRQREETFRTLVEWLHARAVRGPVLFIVEDLHWVDPSTLDLLGQILAEGLHDRILTLLTFRPTFQTPWPALEHQTSLALTRLTRRQVGDLVRKKAGNALPEAVVEQIYDRAGGVPLFVEEFTKMMQELDASHPLGESAMSVSTLLGRDIPATLQDLAMARLDRMVGDRDLAQLAATLGREFSHEQLAAVATRDDLTLQSELASLVKAEILYQKGRPPRCTYLFKHALLQDALYNAMVKSKRQQFHQRIAAVLEGQFPQTAETQPELLGHHFTEAGLTEKAVGFWLKAGLRSRERAADCEAIGHLTKGLALLDTLEETREHDELKLRFLTTLGPASIAVRGYAAPEVGPILLRARELCQRIGDEPQMFGIMLGNWEWRLVRGDLRPCVDLAAEGMALADRLNDPGILMEALFMPAVTMFYRAQFAEARVCHDKALAAYDDRKRTSFWTAYTGHNAGVTHRCYLALALWHLGYPDQALRLDGETKALARTIGHTFSLGHAVDFTACLYQFCRLGSQVEAAADEEIAIGKEQGFQLWHALGTIHKGAGMLLRGRSREALPFLQEGFHSFRATGAAVRVPWYLSMLGDAYTQCARFGDCAQGFERRAGHCRKKRRPCSGGGAAPPQGGVAAGPVARPGRRGRGLFPPSHRDGPTPAEPRVGAAGHDESRPALATTGSR